MHRKTILPVVIGLGLLAVLLAACGGGGATGGGGGGEEAITVNVTVKEFAVALDRTEFPTGVPVTFNVTNDGAIDHELVIEAADAVDVPLENPDGSAAEVEDITPGSTASFTYTFEEAGDLQVACHVAGHYEAGMVQPITVTGG